MFRPLRVAVAAALALATLALMPSERAASAPKISHVLLISIDGMHALDLVNYAREKPQSALSRLVRTGITYTAARTTIPSDSYPAFVALVTGGSPKTTGINYDVFYDHALSPPSASDSCTTIGTVVRFDKNIDFDSTRLDAGGGIDPAKLPRDPRAGCRRVYPHDALRVNTLFEVVKANGGWTAWTDKHPAYEIANGPSGKGVDDLFNPEIGATGVADTVPSTNAYDDPKVDAVVNEIRGTDHTGKTKARVPNIFGMNFQALNTAQITQGLGYLNAAGVPSAGLGEALDHVDRSLLRMLTALDEAHLTSTTAVVLTAKHGQSPIDPATIRYISPAVISEAIDAVGPGLVAQRNYGDGVVLWLADASRTDAVAAALRAAAPRAGFADVMSGSELGALLGSPATDSRAPNIVVRTVPGVLYLPPVRIAAHGGANTDDRNVALVVSMPGLASQTIAVPVSTTQVAPTILRILGLDPAALKAVRIEGTRPLPKFEGVK
jgi:hypothetical protein